MRAGAIAARPAVATAALGVALVLSAGLLDAEPLYVPGVAFSLLALAAALWVLLGVRGSEVHRHVPVRRVVEDEPVDLEVAVRSRRRLAGRQVLDDLLGTPALLPARRHEVRLPLTVRFSRRGRKALPPPGLAVRDPFGLVTWTVRGTTQESELLVLPRVEPVVTPAGPSGAAGPGRRRGRPAAAAEVELDGLRQHRPGSPASRIHWPAFARSGELLERHLRAEGDARPLVVLDPRDGATREDLDAAVRAAASLAHHLALRGGCALLLPGDRRPAMLDASLTGWPQAHARLALVEAGGAPVPGALLSRRGVVFYVSARRGARPPRALAHAPRGGQILVRPGAAPGRRAAFSVAGCSGYDLSPATARAREAVR